MPGNTLFPDTMKQYDDYSIREALHNCIAHQDYTLQERITLIEQPGSLLFSNGGTFYRRLLKMHLNKMGHRSITAISVYVREWLILI